MQGFPGIFCYILGVKVTDLVSLIFIALLFAVANGYDLHYTFQFIVRRNERLGLGSRWINLYNIALKVHVTAYRKTRPRGKKRIGSDQSTDFCRSGTSTANTFVAPCAV